LQMDKWTRQIMIREENKTTTQFLKLEIKNKSIE
jgi:hypothetical protein